MTCKEWLKKFILDHGNQVSVDRAREEWKKLGYKRSEIRVAKAELGVKTHSIYDDGGVTGSWIWYLPDEIL